MSAQDIFGTYLHVKDDGRMVTLPGSESFWEGLAGGAYPQLEQGRLMSAFAFSEPWSSWERHPAGEELGLLISGAATVVLDEDGTHREISLSTPGAFVLIPPNVWHTARTAVPATMLFLTAGAGTEHRPA